MKDAKVTIEINEELIKDIQQRAGDITKVANSFLSDFDQGSHALFIFDDIEVAIKCQYEGHVSFEAKPSFHPLRDDMRLQFGAELSKESPLWRMYGTKIIYRSTFDILLAIIKTIDLRRAMLDAVDEVAK